MKLQIPVEESFICPEGNHPAKLVEVREVEAKEKSVIKTKVRLIFEVYPAGFEEGVHVMAGKNFEPTLSYVRALRQITRWSSQFTRWVQDAIVHCWKWDVAVTKLGPLIYMR
jgi:hypothetical protein